MRRIPAFIVVLFTLFLVAMGVHADDKAPPAAEHHDDKADPAAAGKGAAKADKADKAESGESDPADHTPVTMHIGIDLEKVTKFDLGQGIFEAEFFVSVRCDKECKPNLEIGNGTLKGKPELAFEEKENHVKIYKMKAELTALVDLGEYPFDEHELPIIITDKDAGDVTFVAEGKPDAKGIAIPGWDVTGSEAEVGIQEVFSGHHTSVYGVNIIVKRPKFQGFMKNFAPPLTMVLVLLISLFMKPKMAPARLAAGTGSLVGVVTFHMNITNGIPPLGFFTRIDKFMFSLYLVWLVHIAMSIAIMRAEEQKKEKAGELLYLTAAGVVPGIILILWVVVFTRLV